MNCPKCNSQVTEGTTICPSCGTNLPTPTEINTPSNDNPNVEANKNQPPKKKKSGFRIILVIIIILALASISYGVISKVNNKTKTESSDSAKSNSDDESVEDSEESDATEEYDVNGDFLMPIEAVFTITGRGTVVTGTVQRGTINLNDEVEIVGINSTKKTIVSGLEAMHSVVDSIKAGDKPSVLLKDVSADELAVGQVISKPGTINAYKKFEATVNFFATTDGGSKTPFTDKHRVQFNFRETTDIDGTLIFIKDTEIINPGDTVLINIELDKSIAMEAGTTFMVHENNCVVGSGTVTQVYE